MQPLPLGHPQAALAAGVGMVHQHFALAENISALDNITLGSEPLRALRRDRRAARAKIEGIIERSGLAAPLSVPVGRLSVGERQRVEILKALYRDARILVLDEPTAVLTPQEADTLFANIKAMTRDGLSVIFISHKLREVLAFSDRIAVLRHGRKVGEMATAEADEAAIARMMVGADTPKVARDEMAPGAPVLKLEGVSVAGRSKRDTLTDVDLTVHAHEILGIAGISGNGQSGLAQVISGLAPPSAGRIRVDGAEVLRPSPSAMVEAGIGRIPEDRHREGIVGAMSVAENMVIERLDDPEVQSRGLLRREAIAENAERLARAYDVRGPGVFGGVAASVRRKHPETDPRPRVRTVAAPDPCQPADPGARHGGGGGGWTAVAGGAGAGCRRVVLISEDLDEILGLSDRILVIRDGHLVEAETHDRERIGLMMAGEPA